MVLQVTIPSAETILCIVGAWSIVGPMVAAWVIDVNKKPQDHGIGNALAIGLMLGPSLIFGGLSYIIRSRWAKK